MKTITLEEARKLATHGKLRLLGLHCSNLIAPSGQVMAVVDEARPLPWKANAALLAHCWNTHQNLVDALVKVHADILERLGHLELSTQIEVERAIAEATNVTIPD